MAAPHHQSIDSERPASLQLEDRAGNAYAEDDTHGIYGVEAIAVSDGFRPSHGAQIHDRTSSSPSQSPAVSPATPTNNPANIPLPQSPPPRPTSAVKLARADYFALRHDGRMGPLTTESTATPNEASEAPSLSRTMSMTSEGPILIPEGPYVGPTRPSHAYQMFTPGNRPQRTASVATASSFSMPAEREYSGPSGPAHPYALYPQNTVPELEDESPVVNANIPIGFHNIAGQQYQRRLGPDGEDAADLIGPHGHTEELPPYTKYPDEAYARKMRHDSAPSERDPSIRSGAATQSVALGAGGIGLATRNPEFSSTEDLAPRSSPGPSGVSVRLSGVSSVSTHSAAPVTMPNPELAEKLPENIDPSWKRRAKKRVCGIVPVWALCLSISVVVAVALLLSITLGIVLTNKAEEQRKELDTSFNEAGGYAGFSEIGKYITTVTTTVDASPYPTMPSNLQNLPNGNYSIAIPSSMAAQNKCLSQADHLPAWSCAMPLINLELTIASFGPYSALIPNKQVFLTPPKESLTNWTYGTQAPIFNGTRSLTLVNDLDDMAYGPAWFYQTAYDKLVVLKESTFNTSLTTLDEDADLTPETPLSSAGISDKRAVHDENSKQDKRDTNSRRKGVAYPGDKPWFCYWNGTLMEVFIYTNSTSDAGDAQIAASRSSASVASVTSPVSVWPRYKRGLDESVSLTPSPTTGTAFLVADPVPIAISTSSGEPMAVPTDRPSYPRVVKLEERRLPRQSGYDQPYCKQKLILEDGLGTEDVLNEDGLARSIILSEKLIGQARKRSLELRSAQEHETLKAVVNSGGTGLLDKRDVDGECHCVWMVE